MVRIGLRASVFEGDASSRGKMLRDTDLPHRHENRRSCE